MLAEAVVWDDLDDDDEDDDYEVLWNEADSESLDREIRRQRRNDEAERPLTTRGRRRGVPMTPRPSNCIDCAVTLRGPSDPAGDGSRRHAGYGRCATCYQRARDLGRI